MNRWVPTILAVGTTTCLALAQTFVYDYRESSVYTGGEIADAPPPWDQFSEGAYTNDFSPFDATVSGGVEYEDIAIGGEASQTSVLGATAITAIGEAYAYAFDESGNGSAWAFSDSLIEVKFDLGTPAPIDLSGVLTEIEGSGPPYLVNAHLELYQLVGEEFVEILAAEPGDPFSFTDTLQPGYYWLISEAFVGTHLDLGEPPIWGQASYEMALTIVPEPAALLLLLAGLPLLRHRSAGQQPTGDCVG